jgi:hypothetical protein
MRNAKRDLTSKHIAISVFIVAQSAVILSSMFPLGTWSNAVHEAFTLYLAFFGFDQTYAVFTSPRKINKHLAGFIVYKSGLAELYDYPRTERFGLLDKLRFERFRKYFSDNLDSWNLADGRTDLARYIARTHNHPGDPPQAISLWTVTIPIPPPDGSGSSPRSIARFIDYTVQESDLK